MRPTLKQLQYLVAIAETGKFADAARMMNVSQPSLSTQLADMEFELDTVLIERGRHGATLTPIGEDTVQRARVILASVEELKAHAVAGSDGFSGRMRLGVIPTVGPYLLPSVTSKLHGQYPDFRISVQEERTIDLDQRLREGQVDTLISTAEDHENTHSVPLFTEDLWICVAPDHPLAKEQGPIGPKELKGLSLLSLGHGHNLNLAIREVARLSGAFVSHEYEGTSLDAIRQMAAMGAGVAVLPSLYALVEARRDQALSVRRIDHPVARRQISLVWRDTSPMREQMGELAEILREVAGELIERG
ncbi:MAG: LysR substrate-binding domain-containing protein [Rhizobiaceae bacterium]|nr:LysR substrate-binding domain-containing protein [Rhizobiaceae bacterium]